MKLIGRMMAMGRNERVSRALEIVSPALGFSSSRARVARAGKEAEGEEFVGPYMYCTHT